MKRPGKQKKAQNFTPSLTSMFRGVDGEIILASRRTFAAVHYQFSVVDGDWIMLVIFWSVLSSIQSLLFFYYYFLPIIRSLVLTKKINRVSTFFLNKQIK